MRLKMRQITKFISAALFAFTLFSFGATNSNAQGMKIGYVDDQQILQANKAWIKAQEDWNIESKAWQDEAQAKQVEIQELFSEYEKQKLILSDEKRKEKEAAIRTKEEDLDAYTRRIFGPGGAAEKKQDVLTRPVLEAVTKAIEAVSLEGNYDVVFTVSGSGLGYIKETYDITQKVIDYLDANAE